ncbi:hypothetical protein I7I51_06383 [Histoplasma capsulatum]|uniref:Uncharacterized protein n=1 Tax=Ajellomyces capsulatus TaxID=5037 RepID=A0A8A1MHZ8_AJECA|nr:hypothetical protein I7I51_06383 [Histoplasma capsulatum]
MTDGFPSVLRSHAIFRSFGLGYLDYTMAASSICLSKKSEALEMHQGMDFGVDVGLSDSKRNLSKRNEQKRWLAVEKTPGSASVLSGFFAFVLFMMLGYPENLNVYVTAEKIAIPQCYFFKAEPPLLSFSGRSMNIIRFTGHICMLVANAYSIDAVSFDGNMITMEQQHQRIHSAVDGVSRLASMKLINLKIDPGSHETIRASIWTLLAGHCKLGIAGAILLTSRTKTIKQWLSASGPQQSSAAVTYSILRRNLETIISKDASPKVVWRNAYRY